MKKLSSIVCLILLYLTYLSTAQSDKSNRGEELIRRADIAFEQARYSEAADDYLSASKSFRDKESWDWYLKSLVGFVNSKVQLSDLKKAEEYIAKGEQVIGKLSSNAKETADYYESVARFHSIKATNYDWAVAFAQKALSIRENNKEPNAIIASYNQMADICSLQSKYDEQYGYLQRALALFNSNTESPSQEVITETYRQLGLYYYSKNDFDSGLNYYQKALEGLKKTFGETHNSVAECYEGISNCYKGKKDLDNQLKYVLKAFNIYQKIFDKNSPDLAGSYSRIGEVNYARADYDNALSYFEKALEIYQNSFGEFDTNVAYCYNRIARCFNKKNNSDSEYLRLIKALEIQLKILPADHADIAETYNNLGLYYGKQGQYEAQREYIQKALDIYIAKGQERNIAITYGNLGAAYSGIKGEEYKEYEYIQKAIDLKRKKAEEYDPTFSRNYFQLGKYFRKNGQYVKSIQYFQKSVMTLTPDFRNDNIYINPKNISRVNRPQLLESLQGKSGTLIQLYDNETHNIKDLEHALETYNLCLRVIDTLRTDINSKTSKQELVSGSMVIYEESIALAYKLFGITADKKYLRNAFEFNERSKSFLLLLAFKESEDRGLGALPDSLSEKEKNFKRIIASKEEEIADFQRKNKSSEAAKVRSELLDINQDYSDFIHYLQVRYPKYYNIKYQNKIATVKDIQNTLLDNQTAFIEYFWGDENLYTFSISVSDIKLYKTENPDELSEAVGNLRKALSDYDLVVTDVEQAYKLYTEPAYFLYEKLLKPALNDLPGINRLQVVTDGKLLNIPIEAFLTEPAQNDGINFSTLPYLIKKYCVNYGYSGTLLIENLLRKSRIRNNRCLAFAPSYENEEDVAGVSDFEALKTTAKPLPGAQAEVRAIANYFRGSSFFGSQATEMNFRKEASKYRMIHLAMHGYVNNSNPDYSLLAFSDNNKVDTTDHLLHAYELLNMSLNADLVVLSACETGYGLPEKGEGVKSLARAFMYSGCPSIVMTLWKVNDFSSAKLMTGFYKNLSNGSAKDKALQQAKLEYLDSASKLNSHPAYWAGFVCVGSPAPVTGGIGNWLGAIGLFALAFYGWIWWRYMS